MSPDFETLHPIAEQANFFAWQVGGLMLAGLILWLVEKAVLRRKR